MAQNMGARPGPPQLCGSLTSSLTTTLRARAPYPGSPHPNTTAKPEQAEQQMFLVFSPCHWMSSVHWKTLSKPLDKQVLWDLSAKFRFWPLASSLFAANLFCQTPEDTCSFLFPCLLAHWQGTPEGLWLLLWSFLVGLGHAVHLTDQFKALCWPSREVNPVLPIRLYQNSKIYASLNQKSETVKCLLQ